jgi:predicted adenylyl cyclase CyaB
MDIGRYEIEIKCLLGGRENAERLEAKMKEVDPALRKIGSHRQLNHYFEGKGDFKAVAQALKDKNIQKTFIDLAQKAKDFSLRTREADGTVFLVLKASIDDTTSANGTARREFEEKVDMTLGELDKIILAAGFTYQSKWSRERTEYKFSGANVTVDRNAGYGYLAEFESIEDDPSRADAAKAELRGLIRNIGLEELDQDRLARMFAYYNTHWPEYYGTEKVFTIE